MALLKISSWYSTCGQCGRQVLPGEKKHEWISGYYSGGRLPGCGAIFTHIVSDYMPQDDERLEEMRPDLIIIDRGYVNE